MSDKPDNDAVLAANREFYRAFNQRDVAAMETLWARSSPVVCAHPAMAPLHGRETVLASWRSVLTNPQAPQIRPEQEHTIVQGAMALVVCEEHVANAVLIATNVFVREDGQWRILHHHAGIRAPMARAADPAPPPAAKRTLH